MRKNTIKVKNDDTGTTHLFSRDKKDKKNKDKKTNKIG